VRPIGVVGAGTMGAGIAALAAEASLHTLLYDPDREALARAPAAVEPVHDLQKLAPCGLIVEAAPENLELKRALFAQLAATVEADCVLATNTSSLSVSALAAGLPHPERVVGMHFFNPPAKMRLVEVVAGEESSPHALTVAREAGEAMGKHVIEAADSPGFIVNRCNRPFGLEALRAVQDGLATPEQVDRICRLAGGFRMGPFELMDLVGLDVGLAVSRSFYEQSFGEPRWRPSQLVARRVAAGQLGRKSGRGWYAYPPGRPADTETAPTGETGHVTISGPLEELRARAVEAGWEVDDRDGPPGIVVEGHELELSGLVPPLGRLVEVTDDVPEAAERFLASLGLHAERVGDFVLPRIVAQLVNEACFALGEAIGTAADIDAGMELGLNHPRGPLAWGDLIGPARVLAVLRGLQAEYGDDRWRPAPRLLQAARNGGPLA
jgi:3-hydroxybutyryl-CoA dehydrogenase